MDRTQQETLAEQEALLAECKLYERDKKPETKNALVKNDGEEEASTGVPVGPASTVVGNTVPRTTPWLTGFFVSLGTRDKNFSSTPWSTGLFACLGTGDKNFSSDLEVCVLGAFAPCVLHASNMERMLPAQNIFRQQCLCYTAVYFQGIVLFYSNILAPFGSSVTRIALRRKYNLEGNGARFAGCCGRASTEERMEECDIVCDICTHVMCHSCALCQEGRELRRRTLHPAFQPFMPMTPPMEQSMTPQM